MGWFARTTGRRKALALALLVGATVGAVFSVRLSSALVFASTQPVLAMTLGGNYADAAGRLATAEFALGQGKARLSAARREQLVDGLRFDPLSRRAVSALGLDAEVAGEKDRAERLMKAGDAISRRDGATQLWLLKEAAAKEDWPTTFRHLDAAISTSESAWQQLFPLLTQGLAFPYVREALRQPVQQGRFWISPFLTHAIENSPNPEHIRLLLEDAAPFASDDDLNPLKAKLVARFASLGRVEEASEFAQEGLGADGDVLGNIAITPQTLDPLFAPLTWQIIQQPNIAADPDAESGSIFFSASPGPRSVPLTRHLVLEPGRYRFSFVAGAPPISEVAGGEWAISCISGNQPVLIATVPVDTRSRNGNAATFDLPAGCPGAVFSLVVIGDIEGTEAAFSISDISLARAR
jgi:hypothetical protein